MVTIAVHLRVTPDGAVRLCAAPTRQRGFGGQRIAGLFFAWWVVAAATTRAAQVVARKRVSFREGTELGLAGDGFDAIVSPQRSARSPRWVAGADYAQEIATMI